MKKKDIIDYLEKNLLKLGFIIHKYEAYSTNSVYLKLDYGASNSIRISDHKGYKHLSYKYEINQSFVKDGWRKDDRGFWRYSCCANKDSIDKLLSIITQDRQYKKCFSDYYSIVNTYRIESQSKKGFWQKCKQVKLL